MNFSKFIITSLFLGVLTWDRHHLKGIFQGYKRWPVKILLWCHEGGQNWGQRSPKFQFDLKCPKIPPKSPKCKKIHFPCIFHVNSPVFPEKPNVIGQNFDFSRPIFFTFRVITRVLVGISEICLHIWKVENKCNRMCLIKFFYLVGKVVKIEKEGQNRLFLYWPVWKS